MKLDVKLTGAEAVRRQLLRIGAQAAQKALDKTVVEVQDYVMREAGQHTRTNALFSSVDKRRTPGGWEVFHDLQRAPHAVFVHWGTRPHVIRPRTKRTLRWPSGGQFAFAKEVRHPGYKGDRWMVRAAQLAPALFARHVQDQINRLSAPGA